VEALFEQILINFYLGHFTFFTILSSLCVFSGNVSQHKNTKMFFLFFLLSAETLLQADPNEILIWTFFLLVFLLSVEYTLGEGQCEQNYIKGIN
jgi:hypothetical protein